MSDSPSEYTKAQQNDEQAHTRDVTRALRLAQELQSDPHADDATAKLEEISQILDAIDARTGRRDPTKRSGAQHIDATQQKTQTAHDVIDKAQQVSFGTPNWMALITDLIQVLRDLNVIPSNQPQANDSSAQQPPSSSQD